MILWLFALLLSAQAVAESLDALDAIVTRAPHLGAFLDDKALVDEYYAGLVQYYGSGKISREVYDRLLGQLREMNGKVPGLAARLWETNGLGREFTLNTDAKSRGRGFVGAEWTTYQAAWHGRLRADAKAIYDLPLGDREPRVREILEAAAKTLREETKTEGARREQVRANAAVYAKVKGDPAARAALAWLLHEKLNEEHTQDIFHAADADSVLTLLEGMRGVPRSVAWHPRIAVPDEVKSLLGNGIPPVRELLANEKIFPVKLVKTNRGKLVPAGSIGTGGYDAVPLPRRFHGIWKGLPLGECVGGNCQSTYKDWLTPERWLTVAVKDTLLWNIERNGGYEGFVQVLPIEVNGKTYGSVDFGAPVLGRDAATLGRWLDLMTEHKPAGVEAYVVGQSHAINNAGVVGPVRAGLHYTFGAKVGTAADVKHRDPMVENILAVSASFGAKHTYAGNRMIFDAGVKDAGDLRALGDPAEKKREMLSLDHAEFLAKMGEFLPPVRAELIEARLACEANPARELELALALRGDPAGENARFVTELFGEGRDATNGPANLDRVAPEVWRKMLTRDAAGARGLAALLKTARTPAEMVAIVGKARGENHYAYRELALEPAALARFMRLAPPATADQIAELGRALGRDARLALMRDFASRITTKTELLRYVEQLYAFDRNGDSSARTIVPTSEADLIARDLLPRFWDMKPTLAEMKRIEKPIGTRFGWEEPHGTSLAEVAEPMMRSLKERMVATAETPEELYEALATPALPSQWDEKESPKRNWAVARMHDRVRADALRLLLPKLARSLAEAKDARDYAMEIRKWHVLANRIGDADSLISFKEVVLPAMVAESFSRFLSFPKWRTKLATVMREFQYQGKSAHLGFSDGIAKHGTLDDLSWFFEKSGFYGVHADVSAEGAAALAVRSTTAEIVGLLERYRQYSEFGGKLRAAALARATTAADVIALHKGIGYKLFEREDFFRLPGIADEAARLLETASYPKGLIPLFAAKSAQEFLAALGRIELPPQYLKIAVAKFRALNPTPADFTRFVATLPAAAEELTEARAPGWWQRKTAALCRWAFAKKI